MIVKIPMPFIADNYIPHVKMKDTDDVRLYASWNLIGLSTRSLVAHSSREMMFVYLRRLPSSSVDALMLWAIFTQVFPNNYAYYYL